MLYDAVLLVGIKTGWPRSEILAMPLPEFAHDMDRLTQTDGE